MSDFHGAKTILNEEDEEMLSKRALQITRAISFPMVLKSAMELNVLHILTERHGAYMSAAEVAAEIPGCVNPHAPDVLDRMLCLLSSFSILKCKLREGEKVERVFTVAPICKYLLTNSNDGGSFGPLFLSNHDTVFLESWKNLTDMVLEGGVHPFEKAYGMNCFEYMGCDSRFKHIFTQAMSNHTTLLMNKILDMSPVFEDLNVVVDIGGGSGATLNLITSKYPHIMGINFDLPHILADAPTTNPRVEHVEGDMFEKVPNGDAIFMKWILHDWNDDDCLTLLKNCWKALPDKGKVVIVESIYPSTPEDNCESQFILEQDLVMLVNTPGGRERTKQEFDFLALQSGFTTCLVLCSVYNSSVIEFYK